MPRAGRKEAIPINNIYHLIDRLERLLNESWQIPLSSYLVINEDDYLDVVDQMRTAIPQQVKKGERIEQERDRLVAQAEEEGERILQLAREEASGLVDEHEIIQAANQRAKTVVERAQREAEALKGESDEYARGVLMALDEHLGVLTGQINALQMTVRNGLEALAPPRMAAPEEES